MIYYTRQQVIELLDLEESFLVSLEREEIVVRDAPEEAPGEFSERMLERVRVAHNLIHELEVNLAGAAIIVRMREEMAEQRHRIERFLADLRSRDGAG
jgi:hypothetical protein